ncbi:MAG: GNAT family N-acetyltransferase [Variibacter sp.]|nr:GNAT family N-acetyltransferase [Variibacter sp.]
MQRQAELLVRAESIVGHDAVQHEDHSAAAVAPRDRVAHAGRRGDERNRSLQEAAQFHQFDYTRRARVAQILLSISGGFRPISFGHGKSGHAAIPAANLRVLNSGALMLAPPTRPQPASYRLGDVGMSGTRLADARLTIFTSLEECVREYRTATETCACYAFQLPEFLIAWQETVGIHERAAPLVVHLADAGGRPLLLLPLAISCIAGLRTLEFLGGGLTDYNAPVVEAQFAHSLSAEEFRRLWTVILARLPAVDAIWLRRMPEHIESVPNPMRLLAGLRQTENGYWAERPTTFDAYRANRSTQFFARNRNLWRRIEKKAPLQFRAAAEGPQRRMIVEAMIRQKSAWLRACGLRDSFSLPGHAAFYQRLTDSGLSSGEVLVSALMAGEEIIAAVWALVFRGRACFLVMSRDLAWDEFGAGRLSIEGAVKWCIEQKSIRILDLTVGGEAYKATWTDHTLPLHEGLWAHSLKGQAFVAALRMRAALSRSSLLRNALAQARKLRRTKPTL